MVVRNNLPREYSLKKKADIERLIKTGKKISGDYFNMIWGKNDCFRYAVLVSKKLGTAVTRNKIKRLFREAIRLHLSELSQPIDLVLFPRNITANFDFEVLNAEISRIFRKFDDRT